MRRVRAAPPVGRGVRVGSVQSFQSLPPVAFPVGTPLCRFSDVRPFVPDLFVPDLFVPGLAGRAPIRCSRSFFSALSRGCDWTRERSKSLCRLCYFSPSFRSQST
jgi:hypothetical protein